MSRRPPATQLQRGEEVVVDLTAPARSFVGPLVEAAAWTAAAWLLIGLVDRPDVAVDPLLRGAIVVAWLGENATRLAAPAATAPTRLFRVTTRRIVARPARVGARAAAVDLADVRRAARRGRSTVLLEVAGSPRPLVFSGVPRARRVARTVERLAAERREEAVVGLWRD